MGVHAFVMLKPLFPAPIFKARVYPRRAVRLSAADRVPAATNQPHDTAANRSTVDWDQRRRQRVLHEILEVVEKRRLDVDARAVSDGFALIESLIPGFYPNLDAMKATDWIALATDVPVVAQKVVLLKTHYPRLDLSRVLNEHPRLLLQPVEELDKSAQQVKQLLATAKDMERLLQEVPTLLEPRNLISVLVTVRKWYHLKRDPIEVLEADPDLLRRAQDNDVPLEPVYLDDQGDWTAPLLNYAEKRTDWQAYIDRTRYGQP